MYTKPHLTALAFKFLFLADNKIAADDYIDKKIKYFKFLLNGIYSEIFKNDDSFIKQFKSDKYKGI